LEGRKISLTGKRELDGGGRTSALNDEVHAAGGGTTRGETNQLSEWEEGSRITRGKTGVGKGKHGSLCKWVRSGNPKIR